MRSASSLLALAGYVHFRFHCAWPRIHCLQDHLTRSRNSRVLGSTTVCRYGCLASPASAPTALVTMGAISSARRSRVPEILAGFYKQVVDCRVRIVPGPSMQLLDSFDAGKFAVYVELCRSGEAYRAACKCKKLFLSLLQFGEHRKFGALVRQHNGMLIRSTPLFMAVR